MKNLETHIQPGETEDGDTFPEAQSDSRGTEAKTDLTGIEIVLVLLAHPGDVEITLTKNQTASAAETMKAFKPTTGP